MALMLAAALRNYRMVQVTNLESNRTSRPRPILVTGGAGFIGANFIIDWLAHEQSPVVNLDKLTYAGNLDNFIAVSRDAALEFVQGDISDIELVRSLLERIQPRAIVNFAAESHVDRSIDDPEAFITTNVVGTFRLLECARNYLHDKSPSEREAFRFLHVSTDEVFGSLGPDQPPFCEADAHRPSSPYAASKAASDHLVRAWHHTYGLPVITTNCSNNYGPFQFPEKLIPFMISRALEGKPLPLYGDGLQIRDWLYVADHCAALRSVIRAGSPGAMYNIGGETQKANLDVVRAICDVLDQERPRADGASYRDQIKFVKDRPGHDRRYAIDTTKIKRELKWSAIETFDSGLRKTIKWYLANAAWAERVLSGSYREWIHKNYSAR
jgi:dTDP-glucose 4,6-dehydratase